MFPRTASWMSWQSPSLGFDLFHQCLLSLGGLSSPLSWWKEKVKEQRNKEKNEQKPSSSQAEEALSMSTVNGQQNSKAAVIPSPGVLDTHAWICCAFGRVILGEFCSKQAKALPVQSH
ncbi:uncharacterized protein LJ206_005513 isoform 1-T1 [Theristicus caerulescens]